MNGDDDKQNPEDKTGKRALPAAAQRALAEAEARRKQAVDELRSTELQGRDGPEPTRYGDWESGGLLSDF